MIPLVMSIIAKTETFQRDMARARGHVGQFGKSVQSTSTIMTGFSRQLLALAGVGGGLYALKTGLTSSISTFASFEKGMANVSTLLDAQSMRLIPEYSKQVRDMSMTFGEGTEILSKGLYDIISASVEPSKAIKVLEVSVKAARAGMSDTAIAADALTTILNSYGYEAEQAGRVSDILFTTIRRGKTTFGELAPNIGKVTSLAATAGLSFEELSAALATMTRAGVQTEIAITSLRALILSFLKPQQDSIEAARRYGIELNSNTLKAEGLTGVIKKLEKATAEELATIVPTSRAISGFAAAIKNATGNAEDYRMMLDSVGATEEAFQKIASITSTQLDITKQHWLDLKRTIGEDVAPALNELLPILNKTVSVLDKMSPALLLLKEINLIRNRPMFKGGGGGEFGGYGASGGWEEAKPLGGYEYLTPELPGFDEQALRDRIKEQQKATYDMAQAYVRMYDAIDSKSKESYEWRKKLIEEEYKLYKEKANDIVLVEKLKQERLKQLQMEEALERTDMGLIESATVGIAVALYEIQQQIPSIGKIFHDITLELNTGLVEGLNDALWKTRELDEAMKELGLTIAKMATKMLLQMAVGNAMVGIGGALGLPFINAGVGHSGGRAGDLKERRWVRPEVFADAPRYHDLKPGETAIIAQNDEVISRPGKSNGSNLESLLIDIKSLLQERQTINANIIDKRDIVTKERIESREGEQWTMRHMRRNS